MSDKLKIFAAAVDEFRAGLKDDKTIRAVPREDEDEFQGELPDALEAYAGLVESVAAGEVDHITEAEAESILEAAGKTDEDLSEDVATITRKAARAALAKKFERMQHKYLYGGYYDDSEWSE